MPVGSVFDVFAPGCHSFGATALPVNTSVTDSRQTGRLGNRHFTVRVN